jgi:tRNA threonylcarbamoyladenosine biosynthesis protein TsaE
MQIDLPDLDATVALGHRLGPLLTSGQVVALVGPLGAGKTQLVRAIAEGLGLADSRMVCSPTFVLQHDYPGRIPIHHFDAYRLRSEEEFLDLGVEEWMEGPGVCLIEWADRVAGCLPADHLQIELRIVSETARQAIVTGTGPGANAVIKSLEGPGNAMP